MIRKRSITIRGHRTSVALEDAFFQELKEIADTRGLTLAALVAEIDAQRTPDDNLSSALRLYVLKMLKSAPN